MSDTQWRRYQVFIQTHPEAAHQDAGSVHAPDPEMALLNARDVFSRRPECVSMWVIACEAIYACSEQEIINDQGQEPIHEDERAFEAYYVFCKEQHSAPMTLRGKVEANSPRQAILKSRATFSSHQSPLLWWAFPASQVTQSQPSEVESFYAPARHKTFRLSTDFHTHSAMRTIRTKKPG